MRNLVIFARRPQLGCVKRRLANDIGTVESLRFYRANLFSVSRRLSAGGGWKTWIAITPDMSAHSDRLWPPHIGRLRQGTGTLGSRMKQCMGRFGNDPVVIVGSDIHEIGCHHIVKVFAALRRNDIVFGPSPDGGFWLVGAAQGARVGNLFENVRWSTEAALLDTVRNVKPGRRVSNIETLSDIDDGNSYRDWREQGGRLTSI